MKGKDLLNATGYISDELIQEAQHVTPAPKKKSWLPACMGTVAVAALVCLTVALSAKSAGENGNSTVAMNQDDLIKEYVSMEIKYGNDDVVQMEAVIETQKMQEETKEDEMIVQGPSSGTDRIGGVKPGKNLSEGLRQSISGIYEKYKEEPEKISQIRYVVSFTLSNDESPNSSGLIALYEELKSKYDYNFYWIEPGSKVLGPYNEVYKFGYGLFAELTEEELNSIRISEEYMCCIWPSRYNAFEWMYPDFVWTPEYVDKNK